MRINKNQSHLCWLHRKYPHLEETVRKKLVSLLPHKERKKTSATQADPTQEETKTEKEGLQGWLQKMDDKVNSITSSISLSSIPVRKIAKIKAHTQTKNLATNDAPKRLTRKEKLTTKQYFEEWSKFEDDSEEESIDDTYFKPMALENMQKSRADDLADLIKMLANEELKPVEREFLSTKERIKGNEYFKCFDNDDAYHCYTRSVLLDPSNAKSYSNRAAVLLRLGRAEEAINDCNVAININPKYTKALSRRAMTLHKSGRYSEAVNDFAACHLLEPCAGYDRLQEASKLKLQDELNRQQQEMTRLKIEILDDEVEEVFTPGALTGDAESDLGNNSWQKISIVEVSESDTSSQEDQGNFLMQRVEIIEEESDDEQPQPKLRSHDSSALCF